ncbi:MAG: AEC family transporter [Opitutales bacterium]
MSTYITILSAALPVFLILGTGYLARVRGWLAPNADGSVMKLVINALYPFLILTFILGNPALKEASNIGYGIGLGAFLTVIGISLGYLCGPLGGMNVGSGRRTFAFSTGLNNYGYIAIPVAAAVFGVDSPMMGVLLVCNVGIEAMLWTFGLLVLTGKVSRDVWKQLLNPPLIAMLVGLTLNFAGLPEMDGVAGRTYHIFETALRMMGACAIPLGLLISGATFCDLVRSGEWLGRWQVPVLGTMLRNGLLPALYIAMAISIPFSTELKQVLTVQAAMPAAMLPIVLARYYGGSPAVAVQVIVASTLTGLITIPFWLATGLRLIP